MLSDDAQPTVDDEDEFQTQGRGRGQKHPRDDDQMSTGSLSSKRQDAVSSAEKAQRNQSRKNRGKNKP